MSFQVGDTIGDYEVVGLLGVGGMGTVYRVRNLLSDRIEALKVLLPDLNDAPQLAERFLREIKIQARLCHPNIATLHTALRLNNQLLMLIEYVEGTTLERYLGRGPLDIAHATAYMMQITDALAYAHEHGVVHRDIKPANIMITPGGLIKLMDFGIASGARDRRLTKTGTAVGSLYYMAPEQITGATPDARSDLYSLGVVIYEMVTGQRPVQGDNDYIIMTGHLHHQPAPAHLVNPRVSPELSQLIGRLLAKHPDERFESASHLRLALSALQGRPEAPAMPTLPPPYIATGASPSRTPIPTSGGVAGTPVPVTPVPAGAKVWDPALLERIRKEFAVYIGPMAKVLVDRTSRKCETLDQLYEKLAAEISSSKDREKFLASKRH